jgi:hypothetical protein
MTSRPSFVTDREWQLLLANGQRRAGGEQIDPNPVVKLFTPDAGATWLLTEVDPDDEDRAFGLCDLGHGCPELGYVRVSELESVRGRLGRPIEADRSFVGSDLLSQYATTARAAGRIVDSLPDRKAD